MAEKHFKFEGVSGMIRGLEKLQRLNYPEIKQSMEAAETVTANHAKKDHPQWPSNIMNPDGIVRYHNITVTLTRSISNLPVISNPKLVEGGIFTNIEYAPIVEFKHPFISIALIAERDKITKLFEAGVRMVLKRPGP